MKNALVLTSVSIPPLHSPSPLKNTAKTTSLHYPFLTVKNTAKKSKLPKQSLSITAWNSSFSTSA